MASLIQRCLRFLISWLSTFVTRQSKRPVRLLRPRLAYLVIRRRRKTVRLMPKPTASFAANLVTVFSNVKSFSGSRSNRGSRLDFLKEDAFVVLHQDTNQTHALLPSDVDSTKPQRLAVPITTLSFMVMWHPGSRPTRTQSVLVPLLRQRLLR